MIGQSVSHYRITGKLGEGGMGVVYRATDSKLGREVALKILPEAFAKDLERMARFQREAQVLASLNHTNIAAIYGLEESGGARALVMELVEGPTLAERLARGATPDFAGTGRVPAGGQPVPAGPGCPPLPPDEALPIARQIAEALEYAHEKGIIHRDLKPANIKLTRDNQVKVLDFGLAKALESESSHANISDSPTLTAAATQAGVILGTAAYMSPEQAKGRQVDKRADVWAFGCVLYEMLTGTRPFSGDSVSDTLAAAIKDEPDWSKLPADTPAGIQRLIRRCLIKDPKQRLRDIGEARITIEETASGATVAPVYDRRQDAAPRAALQSLWRRTLPWTLAAISTLVLVVLSIVNALRAPRPPTRPPARLSIVLPPSDRLALGLTPVIALSPDGTRLVYVANHAGAQQLFVRPLDSLQATPIPGTEGAETPFFSPDGQSLGFFARGKLKKVSLSGGAPLALCGASDSRGASWGPDDTIIFTPSLGYSGLFRVSAAGGTPKPLTTPDKKKGEVSHRWPQILPGGKAVLFTVWTGGSFDDAKIAVQSLEAGEQRVLVQGGTYARYVPSGYLVYARAGGLLAAPFDLQRLYLADPPVSVVEGVSMYSTTGGADFSSSIDGSLAYVPGESAGGERTLLWVDRKGVSQALPASPHAYFSPRLSPDGQQLAVGISGANVGVWVYDLTRGALTRVAETQIMPNAIWTPDGKRLTFNSTQQGPWNLFWIPADGGGSGERLTTSESAQFPGSWSPDGQVLAFSELNPATGYDIKVLRLQGDRKPLPFLQTPANEGAPMFSPDGRWLAYQSDESGRNEIYVRPFPGPGGKWQVSTEGGREPMWARNGRELFYRNGDKTMVVAVVTKVGFAAAKPKLLFEAHYEPGLYAYSANYDVSPDGQRFLMLKSSSPESAATQVNLTLNWSDELRRLAPAGKQ